MSVLIYLISSLPMLHFGQRPPITFEKFIALCKGKVNDGELLALERTGEIEGFSCPGLSLKKWHAFDTALRNELVKLRAVRHKLEPTKYLRPDSSYVEPQITHTALNAQRSPSLTEGEKILDLARWQKLEELSFGHYFDLDVLFIYAQKLLILERWEKIRSANPETILKETLTAG